MLFAVRYAWNQMDCLRETSRKQVAMQPSRRSDLDQIFVETLTAGSLVYFYSFQPQSRWKFCAVPWLFAGFVCAHHSFDIKLDSFIILKFLPSPDTLLSNFSQSAQGPRLCQVLALPKFLSLISKISICHETVSSQLIPFLLRDPDN